MASAVLHLAVVSCFGAAAHGGAWDTLPGNGPAGDGVINGGSGVWDFSTFNWSNDGGVTDGVWSNGDSASFGGMTGGVVLIGGGGVAASSLTFDSTGDLSTYTLQSQTGVEVLTLTNSFLTTNQDATINAILGGSAGITKLGAGTLTLGGANVFSGAVSILSGKLRVSNSGALGAANSLSIGGGTIFEAVVPVNFGGGVSIGSGGGTISLASPAAAVSLTGILSGNSPLTVDGSGGGSLVVSNPGNFNGVANSFTGSVALLGGGSVALGYAVAAPSGQTFTTTAGTLSLGNSVPGASVTLAAGSGATASGGVIQLLGRASGPGVGVLVGGDLTALAGGRIEVGDGLDDSGQIAFVASSHVTADGGTIVLRPRASALTLDAGNLSSLSIRNGGVLALAGNADLVINRDIDQSGAWVLANQSANLLRIAGGSQDTSAGLTLRAQSGVIRYEADSINLGFEQAAGTIGVDLRGGTIDINNDVAGKTFTYSPGYTVSGWGQLGTSAVNQTHVIPAGGATFYASAPAAVGGTLSVVGGFNEAAGSKAAFRIGDNNGLMLTVPNGSASPYAVGSVLIDTQSAGSVARFVVGAGGAVQANAGVFFNANNSVRFEVAGGTLLSDVSQTGTLLVNGVGSLPINVTAGGTFITSSPTFLLKSNETLGTQGTLFGFNGTTVTNLTLNGLLDLNGTLGASINGASTGTIRLDAGETLTLGASADLLSTTLAYVGAAGSAGLEVNGAGATVRLGTGAVLATPFGFFGGTREFRTTAGTLQIDAADALTVGITGVNQLSIDRTNDSVANPSLLGTLTLNGGAFQVGTAASTTTVFGGALLSGRGSFGHLSLIDTLINNGTVQAAGGQLTVSAATIKGNGAWDPGGQTIILNGAVVDLAAGSPTTFLVSGSSGGKVQLGQTSTYTGGTVIDGSSGAAAVTLRVIAAGALGSGGVTLNSGILQLNSDNNLSFATTPVNVIGTGTSGISYDHITGTASRTHSIGVLTLGGQTLNLTGPPTSAYNYTLNIASTTVSAAGATIFNTSGSPVNTGPLTLNGNLNLAIGSFNFTIGALSGPGAITRSASSGTLTFNKPAAGFSGSLLTSVGTTNFTGSNTLFGGTYTFAGGTININNGGAGALNGATGTMRAGPVNLNTASALDGANLNVTAGNITANSANALGTGTLQLSGGKLLLKQDLASSFGGTINLSGTSTSFITVDRSTTAGLGGTHSISALSLSGQLLNLTAGNPGYGLAVNGATTINAGAASTIDNEAAQLNLSSLMLNGALTITGTGVTTIGQIGGTAALNAAATGAINLTGAPLGGYGGMVQISSGAVNLNSTASLAGGNILVNGGSLNLGIANALAGTTVSLNSGFINANADSALAGVTLPISNGTLFAAANNSLGNATVNLSGGNVTATAPGALGSANITLNGAVLALRGDASAAFGGNVIVPVSFSTISVAKLTPSGATGSVLSINSLSLGGQTLNVTGADGDVFAVVNPIALSGSAATTINATAADALFQGALTGTGGLIKTGVQTLTLDGGGNFGAATVSGGTLVVNNSWTAPGVTVGGAGGPATVQLGGGGVNSLGNVTVNAGTLRISKSVVVNALPAASALNVGNAGNVKVEYAGFSAGNLANNITVDTTLGARTLTLSSASGSQPSQVSTFTYNGLIVRSGTNALTVTAQADTALDDGFGNLVRPPSRLVLAGNQTYSTDLVHNGGIVIAKGNIPAGTSANPLGTSVNPLQLNVMDSTIGGMVADGQSSATFSKAVTTSSASSPRKRLGAFYNPTGAAGVQTVIFQAPFAWNDGSFPLYVITPAGNPAGAAADSTWNGMIVDPQTVLQINAGATLDNILTASGTNVTGTAPIYIGGGGTVRFNSGFDEASYRSLASAKGLAGVVSVLDNTTLQSSTSGHHFDGVELRTGTYQVSAMAQALAGGFAVSGSPFDPSRTTSSLITDFNLSLTGTGTANAFKIASGQTLTKSGAGTLTINGDQAHAPNSALVVNQGSVAFNTDAGMNGGAAAVNNLSVTIALGGSVSFPIAQHLAQITLTGGTATLTSSAQSGAKVIDATGVNVSSGKLDLTNNRLIVDYSSGGSPMASIRQQIISGFNAGGALWQGNGIVSSTAAASPVSSAVGYGEAADLLGQNGGNFGSEAVDGTAVLVRYTKAGDANLDGTVNFADLVRLAQNYGGSGGKLWSQGDFNYDGVVNFADLVTVAQNYGTALPAGAIPGAPISFEEDLHAAFAEVSAPEPGLGLIGLTGACALLGRKRRSHPRGAH